MIRKFVCEECNLIIDAKGIKQEYTNPIYGPCERYIETCPSCQQEIREYKEPKQSADANSSPCGGCCGCH